MKAADLIAYLGPEGTFSQLAAINHFGKNSNLHACENIEDVFSSVEIGKARYGVVPIENSTEGTVNNTQDCLLETKVLVSGEVVIPIEHQLMDETGKSRSDVHKDAIKFYFNARQQSKLQLV